MIIKKILSIRVGKQKMVTKKNGFRLVARNLSIGMVSFSKEQGIMTNGLNLSRCCPITAQLGCLLMGGRYMRAAGTGIPRIESLLTGQSTPGASGYT